MVRPLILALVAGCLAAPVWAGPIESACLTAERGGGTRSLCACIQQVADATLTVSDQRKAARFFTDPDEAQRVKASDSQSSEAFWRRYADFGEAAEMVCAG